MNCKKVQQSLIIDYPEIEREIEAHLLTCKECSGYLMDIEKIFEKLKTYKPEEVDEELWLSLPRKIRDRLESEREKKVHSLLTIKRLAFGIIFLLLLFIGLIFFNPLKIFKQKPEEKALDLFLTRDIYYELFTLSPGELESVYRDLNHFNKKGVKK